jgi:hypothetical protein
LTDRLAQWNEVMMNNAETIKKRKKENINIVITFERTCRAFFWGVANQDSSTAISYRLVSTLYL